MDWLESLLSETHHQQEHQIQSDDKKGIKNNIGNLQCFDFNNCTVSTNINQLDFYPLTVSGFRSHINQTVGTCTSLV